MLFHNLILYENFNIKIQIESLHNYGNTIIIKSNIYSLKEIELYRLGHWIDFIIQWSVNVKLIYSNCNVLITWKLLADEFIISKKSFINIDDWINCINLESSLDIVVPNGEIYTEK